MMTFEKIQNKFNFKNISKAEIRILRYKKRYPEKDIIEFASRIKKEEDIVSAKFEILERLNINNIKRPYVKDKAKEIVENEKIARDYAKDDYESFYKLKSFVEGGSFFKLYNEDFRNVKLKPESVDLIVTDPPYPKEFLHLYQELSEYANVVLKPGGSLFAMAGQSYLPEVMNLMNVEGMTYNWTLCYLTPGGQSPQLWQRKVNSFWKPVLWYTKGKPSKWMGDVVKSAVNDNDKNFHYWGQSISGMNDLIKRVSNPGDIILDPFMGGGTTGAACFYNLRNFIGIEKEKSSFSISEERLNKLYDELLRENNNVKNQIK